MWTQKLASQHLFPTTLSSVLFCFEVSALVCPPPCGASNSFGPLSSTAFYEVRNLNPREMPFFRLLCQLVQFVTLGHHTPCQSIRARVANYLMMSCLFLAKHNTSKTLWNLKTSKSKQKISPSHSKVHARYAIVLGRRTCPCCVNIEPHIKYTE